MEQKIEFVRDWRTGKHTVSDLCALYGISRRTGYKWIERYIEHGPDGLMERSHATHSASNRTAPEVEFNVFRREYNDVRMRPWT
jgi:transposase-like protein